MYRLLILCVLLNLGDCRSWCRGPHCEAKTNRKEHNRNPEDLFHKLGIQTITTEKKFENFCKHNMHRRVRELYTTDSYVLKYSIPDFETKDLVVKVMHRAIYIGAERRDPTGLKTFRDVKMLPDNLIPEEASWHVQDGELEITLPYQTPIGSETRKSCGSIDYAVITLPASNPESGGKVNTDGGRMTAVPQE